MLFRYLVDYRNADGEFRTYGGPGHMIEASDGREAIAKVEASMPPQVAKTYTRVQVATTMQADAA